MRSLLLLTIFATGTDGCACPESHPTCRGKLAPAGAIEFTCGAAGEDFIGELTDEDGAACSCTANYAPPPPPPPPTMCQVNYNSTVTISDGTHMKVKFELCKGWPKDGNLTIVPPGGYNISKDAAASGSGVTGGLSVLVNDENITIRRDGSGDAIGENSDGHAVEIEITGVIKAPVPMAPYRGNSADFTHTISRQCTAPPMTGQCLIVPLMDWTWDMLNFGGNCTKDGGEVTIAPGSGGATGVQVATCTNGGGTRTLFCQVDSTSALQSHWTYTYGGGTQVDGPPVTSGCSGDHR